MEIEVATPGEEKEDKKPDEYQIKCWYDDIMRAEGIKKDAKKMALVIEYAKKQKVAVDQLAQMTTPKVKDMASLKKAAVEYEEED